MGIQAISYHLEIEDGPAWLSHIEITRKGEMIHFDVVGSNGYSKGEARLSLTDFNDMADILLRQ